MHDIQIDMLRTIAENPAYNAYRNIGFCICLAHNDAHGAWSCCRAFTNVATCGNKNKDYPQIGPTVDDIKNKYIKDILPSASAGDAKRKKIN